MIIIFKLVDEGRREQMKHQMLQDGVWYFNNRTSVEAATGLVEVCGKSDTDFLNLKWVTSGGNVLVVEPTQETIMRIVYTGTMKGLNGLSEWLGIKQSHIVSSYALGTEYKDWRLKLKD